MCGIVGAFKPLGEVSDAATVARMPIVWPTEAPTASASGCRPIATAPWATGVCRSSICPTSAAQPMSNCGGDGDA